MLLPKKKERPDSGKRKGVKKAEVKRDGSIKTSSDGSETDLQCVTINY